MKLSAVRKVATDVTLGLQALHQRGMLPRDIKPANILLDDQDVALLGDFGWVTDEIFSDTHKLAGIAITLPMRHGALARLASKPMCGRSA